MTTTMLLPAAGRLLGVALAGLLALGTTATDAAAQPAASADPVASRASDELPMPGEIFDRYIEALGGWDALSAQKNRRIKGTFEGDPFQFKASVTIWWEADERYHLNIREPAGLYYDLFAVEGMTWSVVMNREPTPIGRVQRQEILDTAEFLGEANYKRRYSQIETMGEAKAGETPVYIVKAVTHAGRPHTLYFAKDSGLLVGDRVPDSGPDGAIRMMTVRIEDYKEFGGTLYPTRFVQTFSDNARPNTMVFNEVIVNSDEPHEYPVPDTIREVFEAAAAAQDASGD